MRKLPYYLISSIILCFILGTDVFASSSTVTKFISPGVEFNNGDTLYVEAQSYHGQMPDEVYQPSSNINEALEIWNIRENFLITGLTKGKYYTGYVHFYFRITVQPLLAAQDIHVSSVPELQTYVTDGINQYFFINNDNGTYRFTLIFDNYYAADTQIQLPTCTLQYKNEVLMGNSSYGQASVANFTINAWLTRSGSLTSSDGPQNPEYVMNEEQSSVAEEISQNYIEAESQANEMSNQLSAVELPSVSSNNLNILGTVDTTQKNSFFSMLSIITHTELVTKIMLIIVIGSLVGFILYGKKGG